MVRLAGVVTVEFVEAEVAELALALSTRHAHGLAAVLPAEFDSPVSGRGVRIRGRDNK
jgi:hypothetical protein